MTKKYSSFKGQQKLFENFRRFLKEGRVHPGWEEGADDAPPIPTDDDVDDIADMIGPLGLSQRRSKTLVKMSYDYINEDWRSDPAVLYGIGKYASDAYRIFCLGEWKDVQPKDHALNDYHSWLKKENYNTLL